MLETRFNLGLEFLSLHQRPMIDSIDPNLSASRMHYPAVCLNTANRIANIAGPNLRAVGSESKQTFSSDKNTLSGTV